MKSILLFLDKHIKGDRDLWILIFLLSIFSFIPIYNISKDLVIQNNEKISIVFYYFSQHLIFLLFGIIILFITQYINYKYFNNIPIILLIFTIILLLILRFNNYIKYFLPILNYIKVNKLKNFFNCYYFYGLVLFIYCAKFLDNKKEKYIDLYNSFIPLLLPIFFILGFIFDSNIFTAFSIFFYILIFLFIGGYPLIHIFGVFLMGAVLTVTYLFCIVKYNDKNTVLKCRNEIEIFFMDSINKNSNTVISQSNFGTYLSKKFGLGLKKGKFKNFLSHSDYFYSVFLEEYGFLPGVIILIINLIILLRVIIISTKVNNFFLSLLVFFLGFPITNQCVIGYSTTLFPINMELSLTLASSQWLSVFTTFLSLGIILSISRIIYDKKPKTKIYKQ